MTAHIERRSLHRRIVTPVADPYFKFFAPNDWVECRNLVLVLLVVGFLGWYFHL